MKLNNFTRLLLCATLIIFAATSCVKEGPMGLTGPAGKDGTNGKDGKDANETCKMCHNPTKVDLISVQYQFSKHNYGIAAFEETGNTGCSPCHTQEAFKDVVKRNVSSGYTLNPTTGRYTLDYVTTADKAFGEIGCSTCHSAIHATYGSSDLPSLTTVAPVPMVMLGGKKIIDLKADGGKSNLCVKCHQPRPQTNLQTGNAQDWVAIAANPTGVAYDANANTATTNIVRPSYRMHIHYGAVGAVYAGLGGVEFAGSLPYTNSAHTTVASCIDCHMGPKGGGSNMVGRAGGHTFFAKGNLTTCNAAGCHTNAITSASTTFWATPRAEIKTLLNNLAAKLSVNGVDILNRSANTNEALGGVNLWAGLTTNNYDGYLNVFDPTLNNPNLGSAIYGNTTGPFQNPSPAATWTAEQKAFNLTLPKLSLTNAQYGAIINFQLCLRDYSLGIHNFPYTKALLTNSIAKL
ncbi:MAG: hypothetical protein Q8S54_18630 [Bacteroidota bacterium]|nr:hypothetical protein [Odoribacter sp.]MDP3645188.1 hypothetical protein [Bacteroidota bacterium]